MSWWFAQGVPTLLMRFTLWIVPGHVVPPSSSKKSSKSSKKIKVHPGNAMVIQAQIKLANCCNMEKDYSATAK